jgi:integrase
VTARFSSSARSRSERRRRGRRARIAPLLGGALAAAGVPHARVYDLRHSFASLLLHEGRHVIYVARQLGHDARLTLTRYGHVMEEYEDQAQMSAEDAIRARNARNPRRGRESQAMELAGLEPAASWVRSRRSPN